MPGPGNRKPDYVYQENREVKNLTELRKFLHNTNAALIAQFNHNNFDLIFNRNGDYRVALRSVRKRGQILTFSLDTLLDWYASLTDEEQEKLSPAYAQYFEEQRQPDNQDKDVTLTTLKALRAQEHTKNPILRNTAREKIPMPWKTVKHISDVHPDWKKTQTDYLIKKLQENTFHLNHCNVNGEKRRVAVLVSYNAAEPALVLTNKDLFSWYNGLSPEKLAKIPEAYHPYFKEECANDRDLYKFSKVHNARLLVGTAFDPMTTDNSSGNSNSFYQAAAMGQAIPNYQAVSFDDDEVKQFAAQNNWAADEKMTHTGFDNELYREIKSQSNPGVKVEQYEKGIRVSGDLNTEKANMAASIAGNKSCIISIRNDENNMTALATAFRAVLDQGNVPFVKPAGGLASMTLQAKVLTEMVKLYPNYDARAALQNNLENQPEAAQRFYNKAFPPTPDPSAPGTGPSQRIGR